MLSTLRPHLAFANVVSVIALFVALGGTGYAAIKLPKNSVGAKQIKRNAVTAAKVKDRSLLARDFKTGQLPRGAQGIQGPTGPRGSDAQFNGAAAGGDLVGSTYPNPQIAGSRVGSAEVADRSLRTTDFTVASGTFTADLPSLAAGTCNFAGPGGSIPGVVNATDIPLVAPRGNATGYFAGSALVVTPLLDPSNQIFASICNISAGAINPGNETFKWAIIR